MTPEYIKRTEKALDETLRLLDKELRYPVELQNKAMVKFYNEHIVKLENYLTTGVCVIDGITY